MNSLNLINFSLCMNFIQTVYERKNLYKYKLKNVLWMRMYYCVFYKVQVVLNFTIFYKFMVIIMSLKLNQLIAFLFIIIYWFLGSINAFCKNSVLDLDQFSSTLRLKQKVDFVEKNNTYILI